MHINLNFRRLTLVLLAAAVSGAPWRHDGPAYSGPWAPPADARCDAPADHGGRDIAGQIGYDSGLVLRYCSLEAMFAQLGAMEQPGLVRAVYVRVADGRWLAADGARYARHTGRRGAASPTLSAYAGGERQAGRAWLSYQQLLVVCASLECSRGR